MRNQEEFLSKPASELSADELEQLLKTKSDQEKKEKIHKRNRYEKDRDVLIKSLSAKARMISQNLEEFKQNTFEQLDTFKAQMLEYGNVKTSGKGNFTIKSDDGLLKVEFSNQIKKEFDERAEAAALLMDEFLQDFVKKKDRKSYALIQSLLTRKGADKNFDVNLINRLEKMRDEFDHPKWTEALDLFKESYRETGSARYVRFYQQNPSSQAWEMIPLNFASI